MSHAPEQKPGRRCPDCGNPLAGKKLYCAAACRVAFHNRMSKRGRVAMPLALGWRARRGGGDTAKQAFAELCRYLDKCNAEDVAAGRPPMADYLAAMFNWQGGARWNER